MVLQQICITVTNILQVQANNQDSYGDWKLGIDKEFKDGINVGYYFTDTDVRNDNGWWTKTKGEYLGDDNHTFYVTKSF
jgi:hypothetical protein